MKLKYKTSIRKPILVQLLSLIKCSIYTTFILSLILILFGLIWNLSSHEGLDSFTMFFYLGFYSLYICYTVIPPSILFVILMYHFRLYFYCWISTEIVILINLFYFLSFIILINYFALKGISLMILFYIGTAMFNLILLLLFQIIIKKTIKQKYFKIKQVCDTIRFHRSYFVNKKTDSTLILIIFMIIIFLLICNINFIFRQ